MNALAKLGALLILLTVPVGAVATWQPSPNIKPTPAVEAWFKAHAYCCLKAERVKTKFRAVGDGQWEYLVGSEWKPINPTYPVDENGVVPTKGFEKLAENDEQFQQLRAEGVLFVFYGSPFCFFVPKAGG